MKPINNRREHIVKPKNVSSQKRRLKAERTTLEDYEIKLKEIQDTIKYYQSIEETIKQDIHNERELEKSRNNPKPEPKPEPKKVTIQVATEVEGVMRSIQVAEESANIIKAQREKQKKKKIMLKDLGIKTKG